MDLQKRRAELVAEHQKVLTMAVRLEGAIAIIDEQIKETAEPEKQGNDTTE